MLTLALMNNGTLTIYSASAGSGKTFRLTKIYLSHLFRSGFSYRKILAVTFTNKATAEMKGRILDQLFCLANGGKSEYLDDLISETGKNEEKIREEASELLFSILHDFSRFSISTIDSFFQKVIRSFARETGLHSGFNVELDHSIILSSAIDEMIASSVDDPGIRSWLTDYVMRNLEEEKSWNLKTEITTLAEELFREKFKILSGSEKEKLEDKSFLRDYINKIRTLVSSTEKTLTGFGEDLKSICTKFGLSDDMFYGKSRGIPSFVRSLSEGRMVPANNTVRLILDDNPRWSAKEPSPELLSAISGGLEETLRKAISYCDENFTTYNTALAISRNVYALGILSDVLGKVRKVTSDENSFLLSEAGEFLNLITGNDQAPFIYEKTGNHYENYMIDEFQDTSILQWKNFYPLIDESMSRGFDNLIVGDIKQSIYRWRNSDWRILASLLTEKVDNERILSKSLNNNWRSRSDIIRFNNTLFSLIPLQADSFFSDSGFRSGFADLYADSVQSDPGKRKGGYVRLDIVDVVLNKEDGREKGEEDQKEKNLKEIVLERIPGVIEMFQDHGYQASDIGIIVREVKEGESVVKRMIDYSNICSPEKKCKYSYDVVSDDSLTLSSSHVINFITAALKVICDTKDIISRAQMVRFYSLSATAPGKGDLGLYDGSIADSSPDLFPEDSEHFLEKMRNRPLFEITESIISFFDLGSNPGNVAYLTTFQDQVLNFSRTKSSDADSFLEWWESTGNRKSISLPSNRNAARILTIHKAKGLEFKIVILPFLSWTLDYPSGKQPIMWIRPDKPPFSDLGIVPVKYSSNLANTFFADDYHIEKYFSYVDNINLLYVAMTRAKDAIYGFIPGNTAKSSTIAGIIKNAITSGENPADNQGIILKEYFNELKGVFEYGKIPGSTEKPELSEVIISEYYTVNRRHESLKLKLHGENYFTPADEASEQKINYGNLMHEVFEGINTADDIPSAINKLIVEGKIPGSAYEGLEKKLKSLITSPKVAEWFAPGARFFKEAEILLPSGTTRRPDRVIFSHGKAIVIDFKFGEEDRKYIDQALGYRDLLAGMGYENIEAFIWYVDKDKIVEV